MYVPECHLKYMCSNTLCGLMTKKPASQILIKVSSVEFELFCKILVSHEKENGVIYMYCVFLRQLIERTTNKHILPRENI